MEQFGSKIDDVSISAMVGHGRDRLALDLAKVGVWGVDLVTKTVDLDESWFQMRGLPADSAVFDFKAWTDRIHPDDHNRVADRFTRFLMGDIPEFTSEHRERHEMGHWVWILNRGKSISVDGKPVRILGTSIDITDLIVDNQSFLQLMDTEKRWQVAIESAGQAVWEVNLVTGLRYHSENWFRMRGLEMDHPRSTTQALWLAAVHPDDLALVQEAVEYERRGINFEIKREFREAHSDGHYIWILSRGRIVSFDKDGNAERVIGTDTDISEIKAAQEQLLKLADHEQRWRTAVESAGEGLWDINHQTGTNYFSDDWRKIRGVALDDTETPTGDAWLETVHPDDRQRLKTEINDLRALGSDEIKHIYRQRHKEGSWVWIMSRGKIVKRDADNNPVRTVGTDSDISALKNSEVEVLRLSHRYEFAVATSEICVWEYDLSNKVPVWDKNTRALYGIHDTDISLEADVWEKSIHPDDYLRVTQEAIRAVEERDSYNMDYRIVRPDGTVRHIRCRAAYHVDVSRGPTLTGASWDITSDIERELQLEHAVSLAEKRNVELEAARKQMEFNSLHDALTGLPNRRQLDMRLEEISANQRHGTGRVALLLIDLDRFKHINDTFGHLAGDVVLMTASAILQECLEGKGLVARTGGDEFIVVMDNAPDDDQITRLAKLLVKRMREPVHFEDHECLYGASIGIAVAKYGEISGRQLLINADTALYRAKNNGRGQFCFYTTEMQTSIVESKKCADAILRGLERGEFFPLYQLQFDAQSGEITGVEALVRWHHPDGSIKSPDQFLPIADEISAVSRIDETILEQALDDLSAWREAGIDIPHLSVNVSAKRLADDRLIERLDRLHIPANKVSFELLESIFLDDQNETIAKNLGELRARGIGIEIDDFGTGHASIACLISLRPNRFKIDRGLIKPIVVSVERRRLVASIVDIGKSLGIQVVAEGVESAEHAEVLRKLDCDCLQGYHFARPMDAAAIATFVKAKAWKKAA